MEKYIESKFFIPEEKQEIIISKLSDLSNIGFLQEYDILYINYPANSKEIDEIDLKKVLINFDNEIKFISSRIIEPKNWNEEWESELSPIDIDDEITIYPKRKLLKECSKYEIIISPKMSFGTGHHATTRLVASALKKYVKKESNWFDVGTGTGLLAILTAMLGANKVIAFDNDKWSFENAIENINENNINHKIYVSQEDVNSYNFETCDGIMANLFSNLLIKSMSKFYTALVEKQGILIVSGILKFDKEKVLIKAFEEGFSLIDESSEDEWIMMVFKANK